MKSKCINTKQNEASHCRSNKTLLFWFLSVRWLKVKLKWHLVRRQCQEKSARKNYRLIALLKCFFFTLWKNWKRFEMFNEMKKKKKNNCDWNFLMKFCKCDVGAFQSFCHSMICILWVVVTHNLESSREIELPEAIFKVERSFLLYVRLTSSSDCSHKT